MNQQEQLEAILRPLLRGLDLHHSPSLAGVKQDTNWTFDKDELLSAITALIQEAETKAVDKKLETLQKVVPFLDLCEDDSNKILVWAKNHRWSLIALPGKNTQSTQLSGGSNND